MNLKRSHFAIKDKNKRGLEKANNYPTIDDLMREHNVSSDHAITDHHRRDLDSLG